MSAFEDGYFELAIVDVPYGIKRDGNHSSKTKPFRKTHGYGRKAHEFKGWDDNTPDESYFNELFRVSQNQIIWGANYLTPFLPPSMGWIFWDKGQRIFNSDGELAFSSFDRALRVVEYNRIELLLEPGETIHPTQKPIKLYKWILKNYAKEGDKILDTHLGSGSSRIAAFDGGYDFTGYELDKDYFDAAEKRFQQHKAIKTISGMSTPARAKHRISQDYTKRLQYRDCDQPQKNDGFVFSDKYDDWAFSKYRKHSNFKALF